MNENESEQITTTTTTTPPANIAGNYANGVDC